MHRITRLCTWWNMPSREAHKIPSEAMPASKKLRVDTTEAQAAKRERKRIHNLQKAYEKHVAKHGDPPLLYDIKEMLGEEKVAEILSKNEEFNRVAPFGEEIVVKIERLSSHGDGLARTPQGDRLLAIPFALPGEVVSVYPYASERLHFKARLVNILEANTSLRRDDLVQCQYFGRCGGCQYQMIPYENQMEIKKDVVANAFRHYSKLDSRLVPDVLPTMGSPQTMQYRTKLTPHFDIPMSLRKGCADPEALSIPIGFDGATTGRVMDIEECPIGTPVLNKAMKNERAKVRENIQSYKNGATILLRDSLPNLEEIHAPSIAVTDHKATVFERVGDTLFSTPAGAFFQNNRSIIPLVIDYIQTYVETTETPRYLVDTYCGSGLFALTLAPLFSEVAGVEISASSIECAEHNAKLNHVSNAKFLAGQAENIFAVRGALLTTENCLHACSDNCGY